ncbi:MAG: hypothetical protein GY865_05855 [candidate division Zixibacteria bacterium]|nr:hypothetical protein [candidate division Zixibacteria bacterium]
MKIRNSLSFIFILLLSISLFRCETQNKEIVLGLKFNENQSLRWQSIGKNHWEYYENDSLISIDRSEQNGESIESVLTVFNDNSARLRLIYYYVKELPDENDTTKLIKVKDSSITEYIQDIHGVNLDIIPHDTSSVEKIEYVKKLYEQLAPRYPDEPVSVGFKWSNNIKVMLQDGETRDAVTTYTVKGFVREAGYDCAIIEYKGNTIVPFQGEYANKEGNGNILETRIDKRSSHGTTYLAYKEGIIVKEDYSYETLSEGTKIIDGKEIQIRIISSGSQSYFLLEAFGI